MKFKREGHSGTGVFFEIANKKITLSWVTDRGFSF